MFSILRHSRLALLVLVLVAAGCAEGIKFEPGTTSSVDYDNNSNDNNSNDNSDY